MPVAKKEDIKVWVTTTNNFKAGGKDEYKLISTVPVDSGITEVELPGGNVFLERLSWKAKEILSTYVL